VTLTVTDPCGNFSTCTAIVTVLEGNVKCNPQYDVIASDPVQLPEQCHDAGQRSVR
jgi:hypothetical protein